MGSVHPLRAYAVSTIERETIAQGRRRLKQLLPAARARVRKGVAKMEAASDLGAAHLSNLTEDNLDALVVYPAPLGGWHADVLLQGMAPGLPNSLGTPVGQPVATREEAEKRCTDMLDMLLAVIERNQAEKVTPRAPVFLLYGWTLQLNSTLYETVLAVYPERANGYGSPERAEERVAETLATLAPDGFDGEQFNQWPRERKVELLTVLHIAALSGLYRYPAKRDASPSGHSEMSEARH